MSKPVARKGKRGEVLTREGYLPLKPGQASKPLQPAFLSLHSLFVHIEGSWGRTGCGFCSFVSGVAVFFFICSHLITGLGTDCKAVLFVL